MRRLAAIAVVMTMISVSPASAHAVRGVECFQTGVLVVGPSGDGFRWVTWYATNETSHKVRITMKGVIENALGVAVDRVSWSPKVAPKDTRQSQWGVLLEPPSPVDLEDRERYPKVVITDCHWARV